VIHRLPTAAQGGDGKIAFSLQAGWAVRDYSNLIEDFEWGVAPIPAKRVL
jgi:hypothetical protein